MGGHANKLLPQQSVRLLLLLNYSTFKRTTRKQRMIRRYLTRNSYTYSTAHSRETHDDRTDPTAAAAATAGGSRPSRAAEHSKRIVGRASAARPEVEMSHVGKK